MIKIVFVVVSDAHKQIKADALPECAEEKEQQQQHQHHIPEEAAGAERPRTLMVTPALKGSRKAALEEAASGHNSYPASPSNPTAAASAVMQTRGGSLNRGSFGLGSIAFEAAAMANKAATKQNNHHTQSVMVIMHAKRTNFKPTLCIS